MRNTPDFFHKLVDSVAPTIFCHREIKRAILLMRVGSVHKLTHEGINLRGHQCLYCRRSQLCKISISQVLPFFFLLGYFILVSLSNLNSLFMLVTVSGILQASFQDLCIHLGNHHLLLA